MEKYKEKTFSICNTRYNAMEEIKIMGKKVQYSEFARCKYFVEATLGIGMIILLSGQDSDLS